ncbi:MAG: ABC transporter permease [Culicoidibacterales bacterium]
MPKKFTFGKYFRFSFLGAIFVFLYLPIIFMIVFSFNESKTVGNWTGFSLKWYEKLFSNATIQQSLIFTLVIATVATIIALIIGTISAIGIYYTNTKRRQTLLTLNQIPIVSPDIIIGVSTMLLFILMQLPFGGLTVLLAHVMFCTPVVIISIMPRFYSLDSALVEAAEDLGASPLQVLKVAILPHIRPGIIAGAIMSFTFSLDDFVVTYFTAGEGVSTLSIEIYTQIKRQVSPELNALSTIMLAIILIGIIGYWAYTTKKSKPQKNKR